ncbi:MAG: hypothetical protein M0R39_00505 [Prolixibacteraceae bacterium]|nr:hypothetical protein [Prolixibacteraceae bacterium]
MMKVVQVTAIVLAFSLVSFGKTHTPPLQSESLSLCCTSEATEIPMMFSASSAFIYLNYCDMTNRKVVRVVENRKKSTKVSSTLTERRKNNQKLTTTTKLSGRQLKTLLSKKMANLLYAESVDEFSYLWKNRDSNPGTKDAATPFVSYYPGLLNDKIL